MTKIPFLIFLLGIFLCTSCGLKKKQPVTDLNRIYGDVVQTDTPAVNPVIVIPGILGSKILDPVTQKPIWGIFDNKFLDPKSPEDIPVIALPFNGTDRPRRGVPDGALSSIRFRALGLPVQQRAYASILGTLGAGGFLDEELHTRKINWGKEHFSCFQFSYDWRLSNSENADALHRFILEKKRYVREQSRKQLGVDRPNLKFDIVAHSMGGLVARYYLRHGNQSLPANGSLPKLNWAGAKHVNKLIMVGTPNFGSILSLNSLLDGQNFVPAWQRFLFSVNLPNFPPAIIGSYPSLYELLPRTRHQPLLDQATNKALDLYDPNLWINQQWGIFNPSQQKSITHLLPSGISQSERDQILRNHIKVCLSRAQQFHRSIDRPATPPKELQISLIAGDAIATPRQIKINLDTNKRIDNDYRPGDGTVIRSSTLADESVGQQKSGEIRLKSPIKFRQVTFLPEEHLDLTSNPTFTDNLLYRLLIEPR